MSTRRIPLGFIFAAAILLPFAAHAVTPSGTQISALATADCTTTTGTKVATQTSNTASVSVQYPTGVTIGAAKKLADGQFVELAGTVAIAGTPDMAGKFYIESPDRSTGIRVQTTQTVSQGDLAIASGTLMTSSGERQITAAGVKIVSSGNALPKMLYLSPSWYRASDRPVGLLVKVFGRITAAPSGASYFYLDDGAPLKDGSGYTGVRVYGIAPSNPVGRFASVVGIPGAETFGQGTVRVLRTRRSTDISLVSGIP